MANKATNTVELEKLLSRFYTRYNPEKLSTVNALAVQFVGKEDTLNRLLKERYDADLNDILLAPQGNPEVPPHQEADAIVPSCADEESSHTESDETAKWEATMSSMDSTISKAEISSGANLSAIVKATSKALKAALQENQELKILNQELCVQIEQREQLSGDAQVRAEEVEEALSKARDQLASRREEIERLRLMLQESEASKNAAIQVQLALQSVIEAKESGSDAEALTTIRLLQDKLEKEIRMGLLKDQEIQVLKEQKFQVERRLQVMQDCGAFSSLDKLGGMDTRHESIMEDQVLETIFERNSVASDWESTGRASPRTDVVPGDWDQSLSTSPCENERGPGSPLRSKGPNDAGALVPKAISSDQVEDAVNAENKSASQADDSDGKSISDQVLQLRKELEASVRQQQALAEFWSSEKEKFMMMEQENLQLKRLLSSARMKHVPNPSPLAVAQHNLIGVVSEYEGRAYLQPPGLSSPAETPRKHRISSEPLPLTSTVFAYDVHQRPPTNEFIVDDLSGHNHSQRPTVWNGDGQRFAHPGDWNYAKSQSDPSGKVIAEGQWIEPHGLRSGEWDRTIAVGSPGMHVADPTAGQNSRLWQAPRRRAAQHVPAIANRMMSPTPSNPEDEALGPGLGAASPVRSQDGGGMRDTPAVAVAGTGPADEDRRIKASAISDESLLQALYNANLSRASM